ncbi:MAG: hypothetical protein AVDCRST_MAG56-8 [uncultured Cytophagales bacterium]|uniref:DUF3995 domain-containing protein n=1 Tax=uncultured Cytophagales bacterium TaxID=158755 RepID=A0A6J4H2A7_9SPHI|nr:MAG: hypothetical protein AVDCRST_MAG56-8 [uncultured Cytophagales bacterium]
MITLTGVLLALMLLALSALHLYWAAGGRRGFDAALPRNEAGKRVLNPGKTDCVVVAAGLFLFAGCYLIRVGVISVGLPAGLASYGVWAISAIFALRALGDFRYVGFSKRIRNTDFARRDTRYYAPLCVLLALGGVLIELMQ